MKRRDFLKVIGRTVAVWPVCALAQQPRKLHRVGFLMSTSPMSELVGAEPINPVARAFLNGLRSLGYAEGQNLLMEWRTADGRFERFPEIIRELVTIKVDVIVTVVNPMTRAAKEATKTVPIVMAGIGNPVEEGLIESLARPGGNITGLAGSTGDENLTKRLQLLKELLPGLSRVALLQSKAEMTAGREKTTESAARRLGVEVLIAEHTPTNYTDAFAFIARQHVDAISVAQSGANFANRHFIIDFATNNRLPAIYGVREFATDGGLIAYGPDFVDIFRRAAGYVDLILRGTKPADLPVEQPTKFELVIASGKSRKGGRGVATRKPFTAVQRVQLPPGKGEPASRKRVLHVAVATPFLKRRQQVLKPRVSLDISIR